MNPEQSKTTQKDVEDAIREYKDAMFDLEEAQAHVEEAKQSLLDARDEFENAGATEEQIEQLDDTMDYYNL